MSTRVAVRIVRVVSFLVLTTALCAAADAQIARTPLHRTTAAPAPSGPAPRMRALGSTPADLPYHNGATLLCSDCHTMHSSEAHDLQGTTPPGGIGVGSTPTGKLLRRSTALDLCLACHDGRAGIPDVVTSDSNGLADRAAGFFATEETANFRGHNLQRNPDAAGGDLCSRCHFGGSMGTAGVTCTDCHNKHGNGGYRNLQWASWPDYSGQPPIKALIRPGATALERYERANIAYVAPAGGDSSFREVTNICIDCHHGFFSPYNTQGASPYHRHPGTNSENAFYAPINRTAANTDPAYWLDGRGPAFATPRVRFLVSGISDFTQATTPAVTNEVFCLTCHQAHGSDKGFATTWNYGSGNSAGCQQCHNR